MNVYDLVRRPIITEKNTLLMESGQYTFEVAATATKPQVKAAVEQIFGVNVVSVNTLNVRAKPKMKRRRGGRPIPGSTTAYKKAMVRLAEGQRIEVFES